MIEFLSIIGELDGIIESFFLVEGACGEHSNKTPSWMLNLLEEPRGRRDLKPVVRVLLLQK